MNSRELLAVFDEVARTLKMQRRMGVRGFDCGQDAIERLTGWGRGLVQHGQSLDAIRADLGECTRCPLAETRHNIVFGEGDPHARLLFIGEAPGFEEDKSGRPFVGAAGQLLDKIIAAIHLKRDEVYIGNIIKCRPPRNRDPQPDEIHTCFPFLKRQIAAISPEFICTLGRHAAQTLLETTAPISRLRGRLFEFEGIAVLPTYHPAYLLHNPDQKRAVWEDMKRLMEAMGIEHND